MFISTAYFIHTKIISLKTKSIVYGSANFTINATSIAIPVYLVTSLARAKACKQLSPRKQLGLTCQTKTDVPLIQTYGRKLWGMFLLAVHQNYNTVTDP